MVIDPVRIEHVGWVAAAGLVGFIGNELVALYRIRVGRRIGSAATGCHGLHARTDGFTSLAVLLSAGGVALGFPLADPIVGMLITVAIVAVLRTAARMYSWCLMDGVDPELVDTAEAALSAQVGRDGRAQCADALDRTPPARRCRVGRRTRHQPGGCASAGTRRRARADPRSAEARSGSRPLLCEAEQVGQRPTPQSAITEASAATAGIHAAE